MKIISIDEQLKYWKQAKYRCADDPVTRAYVVPKVEFITRHVSLINSTILDLGCGNGAYTVEFMKHTNRIVGLDISAHMLFGNPWKKILMGNAEKLPFGDGSFDIIFSANLFHHCPNPMNILKEMKRVSKKYIISIEPNGRNPVMFIFSLIVKAERGGLKSTLKSLKSLFEIAGLKVIKIAATGMISQNNTPGFLIPYLQKFDGEFKFGEYIVAIAKKDI